MKLDKTVRPDFVAALSCLALIASAAGARAAQPDYVYELNHGSLGMQDAGAVVMVDFKAADAAPSFVVGSSVITRAQLDVSFTGSDVRRLMNAGPVETSYQSMVWGTRTLTTQTKLFDDMADTVAVKAGGGAQTALADDFGPPPYSPYYQAEQVSTETKDVIHDTRTVVTNICRIPNVFVCPDGWLETKVEVIPYNHTEVVRIDTVTEITGGYKGSFSLQLGLNPAALSAFSLTGVLPVAWEVRSGGVSVDSATLRFDVASVPEPATSLTFGGGALVLGMFSMRRRLSSRGDAPTAL